MIQRKQLPYKKQLQAGFTLVELMVSLSLFTIVVLATISSLLIVNDASRKVQSMRTVMDNLTFAMESMSRTIRTGSNYVCGGSANSGSDLDCAFGTTNGSDTIQVKSVDSTPGNDIFVEYKRDLGVTNNGTIEKRTYSLGVWSDWQALTSPEINVQSLIFYVAGANASDSSHPSVTLFVQGTASATATQVAPFAIQTRISQRAIK